MKLLVVVFINISLYLGLVSCGGVDNSEPPATLVDFAESSVLTVLDEIEIGETSSQYYRIDPLDLNKSITFSDQKGLITSFNKETFKIRWKKDLKLQFPSALGGDQSIFVIGTRSGELIALNPVDGEILWRVVVSSEILAKPVISQGTVIIKTVDGQISALKSKTGQQLWTYKRDVPALSVRGNSIPEVIDDKIITGLDNGKLVILDLASGVLVWEKTIAVSRGRSEVDRLVDLDADLLVQDSVIFIGGFQGKVVALDLQTGDFLWTRKMSVVNNMTIENQKLYITDARSHIWCLDASTGATVWKQRVFTARKLTSPVVSGPNILLADYQGYLHVIDKSDGHLVSRLQVDESGVDIKPIIIGDKIYLQSKRSKIYILDLKELVL